MPSGGGSGQAFVEAVLNQYVTKDDQQKMVLSHVPDLESEWTRGFQQLKSLGPDIYQHGVYPASQDQVYQLLGNGTTTMCSVWSDQGLTGLKSGQFPLSVKLTEISPPLYGGPAYLGGAEGLPNEKLVFRFMNFLLGQAEQAEIVDRIQGLPGSRCRTCPPRSSAASLPWAPPSPSPSRPRWRPTSTASGRVQCGDEGTVGEVRR